MHHHWALLARYLKARVTDVLVLGSVMCTGSLLFFTSSIWTRPTESKSLGTDSCWGPFITRYTGPAKNAWELYNDESGENRMSLVATSRPTNSEIPALNSLMSTRITWIVITGTMLQILLGSGQWVTARHAKHTQIIYPTWYQYHQ